MATGGGEKAGRVSSMRRRGARGGAAREARRERGGGGPTVGSGLSVSLRDGESDTRSSTGDLQEREEAEERVEGQLRLRWKGAELASGEMGREGMRTYDGGLSLEREEGLDRVVLLGILSAAARGREGRGQLGSLSGRGGSIAHLHRIASLPPRSDGEGEDERGTHFSPRTDMVDELGVRG